MVCPACGALFLGFPASNGKFLVFNFAAKKFSGCSSYFSDFLGIDQG